MALEDHLWMDVVVDTKCPSASLPPRIVEDNTFNTRHRIVIIVTRKNL